MSWDSSRALTPLKRDFLEAFFSHEHHFFLTGGSALGAFYLQHRLSNDLDLFTSDPDTQWVVVRTLILDVAAGIGAQAVAAQTSEYFCRYVLDRGAEHEIVDFVIDLAPQVDVNKEQFGPVRVDTLREIAANKMCTLVGRSELKDLVDVYFLEGAGVDLRESLDLARIKDGGVDPAMIAVLLRPVKFTATPDYMLVAIDPAALNAYIDDLCRRMATWAHPTV